MTRSETCAEPNEQPMSVHGRVPIVTAVKRGRQCSRRRYVCIAVQHMTDLVRILLLDARQRQLREPFSGLNFKSAKGRIRRGELWSSILFRRRGSVKRKQKKSAKKIFHQRAIIASGGRRRQT